MESLSEEFNSCDKVIMNKITALKRAQKSGYIPKAKPFLKNKNEEYK